MSCVPMLPADVIGIIVSALPYSEAVKFRRINKAWKNKIEASSNIPKFLYASSCSVIGGELSYQPDVVVVGKVVCDPFEELICVNKMTRELSRVDVIAGQRTLIAKLPESIKLEKMAKHVSTNTICFSKHHIDLQTNQVTVPDPAYKHIHHRNHIRVTIAIDSYELNVIDTRSPPGTPPLLHIDRALPGDIALYENLLAFSFFEGFGQIRIHTYDLSLTPAKLLPKSKWLSAPHGIFHSPNQPYMFSSGSHQVYSFASDESTRLLMSHGALCFWSHFLLATETSEKKPLLFVYDLLKRKMIRSIRMENNAHELLLSSVLSDFNSSSLPMVAVVRNDFLARFRIGQPIRSVQLLQLT